MTILSDSLYQSIYEQLSTRARLDKVFQAYPMVDPVTIKSIYRLKGQEGMKRMHLYHQKKINSYAEEYYKSRHEKPFCLIEIARKIGIPSYFLAKLLMANYFLQQQQQQQLVSSFLEDNTIINMESDYLNYPSIKRFMKLVQDFLVNEYDLTYSLLDNYYIHYHEKKSSKAAVGSNFKGSDTIPDVDHLACEKLSKLILEDFEKSKSVESGETADRKGKEDLPCCVVWTDILLLRHIRECMIEDDLCSPIADTTKHMIGKAKEEQLFTELQRHQIAYMTESDLGKLGYPKTPDALLTVPIAVLGHPVNWIESKAFFGNTVQHESYLQKQYLPYLNRYGPGLVIYWCGHMDSLISWKQREQHLFSQTNSKSSPNNISSTNNQDSLSTPLNNTFNQTNPCDGLLVLQGFPHIQDIVQLEPFKEYLNPFLQDLVGGGGGGQYNTTIPSSSLFQQ